MRKRYAVMLAIAAMICGVVIFQAVTATPPEPYVRLVGDGRPLPPVARTACRDGEAWILYTTGEGQPLEPVPTGDPCGTRGWDAYGPINRPNRRSDYPHSDRPTPEQSEADQGAEGAEFGSDPPAP